MPLFEKLTPEEAVQDKTSPSSDEGVPDGFDPVLEGELKKVTKISSVLTVIVSGLALFSDGYNAQIIGYMEPLFSDLYKTGYGDGIGMLFFGFIIDKIGRRTGIIFATFFLVLGVVLATAAHGYVS